MVFTLDHPLGTHEELVSDHPLIRHPDPFHVGAEFEHDLLTTLSARGEGGKIKYLGAVLVAHLGYL
jgi:hypothetical protein